MYYILLFVVLLPFLLLFPTRVKGQKHIPKKGRVILVCNHQSGYDALLIASKVLKRRFYYMSKAELFKNKFLGAFFKSMGMYPVNRQQADLKAVKKTLGLLKNEKAVCIFPEGTRIENTEMNDAKNGVAMFALKTKSPIVPSVFVKKPGIFRFNTYLIGEAFILSEMEEFKDKPINKEILVKATEIITEKMKELKDNYLKKKK